MYYLSDLDYSTREDIVYSLKTDEYKDIVDLKYRMKQTDTEINFILFKENTCNKFVKFKLNTL